MQRRQVLNSVSVGSVLVIAAALGCGVAAGQTAKSNENKKPITYESVYGPNRINLSGSYARGMIWLPGGEHFLHRRDGGLRKVNALSDEASPAYDREAFEAALLAHEDFDEAAAKRTSGRPGSFSPARDTVLIRHRKHYYLYRFADAKLTKLTKGDKQHELAVLSPKSRYLTFVRNQDLYVIDSKDEQQRRLTQGGGGPIFNAKLDWVYMEEVYGRGRLGAYWWRDDEKYIAYLHLDDTQVPLYSIVDQMPLHSKLEQTHYPKPGDPNPLVKLGVLRPSGGETLWVDLSKYGDDDILIVRVTWAPDGKLIYQVQDREQRWLELNEADPKSGESRTLLRETTEAWVNVLGQPHWLDDGSFLWESERDGWRHLYHYQRDGTLLRRVTSGEWEMRSLHGVDEETGWVYFSGTRDSHIESNAYRVKLAGGGIERLTEPGFNHRTQFDPTFGMFIDTFDSAVSPPKVYLRKSDGSLLRVISENKVAALDEYIWSKPEFLRVPARDGYMLNARIIRPPDFDPRKKYPVWSSVYGGPHAPQVRNTWSRGRLADQMLAQKGIIIWTCDPRSASGMGAVSAWHAYQRLGETELEDLEDAARWLIDQGYVDPQRIGITGHSYGGTMAAYALTHGDVFTVGIAGSPVTDWRDYDTIYTERYMRTPANNPDGYDRTSVVKAAKNLHGRLLLLHGAMDDNVHLQNTVQFVDALQRAGKMFDLMIYPKDRHGIGRGSRHLRDLKLKFIEENLLRGGGAYEYSAEEQPGSR
ncbi:MAG: S9 family peptidase [Planctomycetes bacterium]|nr:S9 family peptidase [Planctomycetota bacterium]